MRVFFFSVGFSLHCPSVSYFFSSIDIQYKKKRGGIGIGKKNYSEGYISGRKITRAYIYAVGEFLQGIHIRTYIYTVEKLHWDIYSG